MSDRDFREAKFRTRVITWTVRLKVKPVEIRLQAMVRKWASCSPRGRVTFSRDLLDQPRRFQDYVIVHELLHLKVHNHGKLFKNLLRAHLGSSQSRFPREHRNGLYLSNP